jgi:hypothetical protein
MNPSNEGSSNKGMEPDALQLTLRSSFRARLMPSVRLRTAPWDR